MTTNNTTNCGNWGGARKGSGKKRESNNLRISHTITLDSGLWEKAQKIDITKSLSRNFETLLNTTIEYAQESQRQQSKQNTSSENNYNEYLGSALVTAYRNIREIALKTKNVQAYHILSWKVLAMTSSCLSLVSLLKLTA